MWVVACVDLEENIWFLITLKRIEFNTTVRLVEGNSKYNSVVARTMLNSHHRWLLLEYRHITLWQTVLALAASRSWMKCIKLKLNKNFKVTKTDKLRHSLETTENHTTTCLGLQRVYSLWELNKGFLLVLVITCWFCCTNPPYYLHLLWKTELVLAASCSY